MYDCKECGRNRNVQSGGTEEIEEKPVGRPPDSESNPGLSTKQAKVLIRLYYSPRLSAEVTERQIIQDDSLRGGPELIIIKHAIIYERKRNLVSAYTLVDVEINEMQNML